MDEIVGISELHEKDTIEFIKNNKISNISFLIDSKNSFNKTNFLDSRYEMILDNLSILEYRKDPSTLDLVIYSFFSLYFLIFFFLCLIFSYYVILKKYLENLKMEMHLKKTFYDDGSVSRLIWHHRLRLRRRRRRRQNGRLKRLTDEKTETSTDTMTTSETWILSLSAGSH